MLVDCLASADPLTHVVDHIWKTVGGGDSFTTFTVMSNHVFMMLVAAALMLLIFPRMGRIRTAGDEVESMIPRGGQNLVETICVFLRDSVARPTLGDYTDSFISYVWTAFFFVLFNNLLGILPLQPLTHPITTRVFAPENPAYHGIYGTATGNIWTTATLAICTLLMIVANGLRLHGLTYIKHFFMGPFPINVIIAFLEVVGLVAKTFALAVRLFANMVAGHILLAVLLGFIFSAGAISAAMGFGIAVPAVLGSVGITLLELFVAFLQAFIFTFLSCVFIGGAVNIHHEKHEGHEEAHAKPHEEAVA